MERGSDFQILAHFAKRRSGHLVPESRGWRTKFATKGVREMGMTCETQIQGKIHEIASALRQSFQ